MLRVFALARQIKVVPASIRRFMCLFTLQNILLGCKQLRANWTSNVRQLCILHVSVKHVLIVFHIFTVWRLALKISTRYPFVSVHVHDGYTIKWLVGEGEGSDRTRRRLSESAVWRDARLSPQLSGTGSKETRSTTPHCVIASARVTFVSPPPRRRGPRQTRSCCSTLVYHQHERVADNTTTALTGTALVYYNLVTIW